MIIAVLVVVVMEISKVVGIRQCCRCSSNSNTVIMLSRLRVTRDGPSQHMLRPAILGKRRDAVLNSRLNVYTGRPSLTNNINHFIDTFTTDTSWTPSISCSSTHSHALQRGH